MTTKNIPIDKVLYEKTKKEAKRRFNVWPSAYASGWLVKEYKRRGGKYKISYKKSNKKKHSAKKHSAKKHSAKKHSAKKHSAKKHSVKKHSAKKHSAKKHSAKKHSAKKHNVKNSNLSRWFREKWIDVCELPNIVSCGRKSARKNSRSYPYCRPLYKISSKSPKTVNTFYKKEIQNRCKRKKKNPKKRIV